MSQRESNLLWLKDMLEHMKSCQRQLEWTEDPETIRLLTDSLLRDLESCRKLCQHLQERVQYQLTH